MAFTVTARHAGDGASTASATQTTDSHTPSASSLLLTFSGLENNGDATAPAHQTPTGGSLTYTLVAKTGESPTIPWTTDDLYRISAALWRADVGGSPSAFAVTVDGYSGATTGFYQTLACDITGHTSSTPVQSKVNSGSPATAGDTETGTVTLDSTPTTGNLVVVGFAAGADTGGAFTAPTVGGQTMTQVAAQNNGGFCHAGLWYRIWTGAESNNVITCTDLGQQVGNWIGIAVEVAGTGGGPAPAEEIAAPWKLRPPGRWSPASRLPVPARGVLPDASQPPAGPLLYVTDVAANGRYLIDQNSDPILVKGDSPWAILVDCSTTEMDLYVSTRAAQGFNTVLCGLLGSTGLGGPNDSGANVDGALPFVGGDPTVLTDAYWDRVEYFLTLCRDAGITVMAYPIDGWCTATGCVANGWSNATADAYGQAVAARLSSYENIIWAVGGDYNSDNGGANDQRQYNVLVGLATGGMDRPRTVQFTLNQTSLDGSTYWDDAARVDFSFVYAYSVTYAMVENGYTETNDAAAHIPALMSEAHYEAYAGITDLYIRSQAAWSLTAGSPGEFYGHEDIWDTPPTEGTLETTAVAQLSALRAAFESLDGWHDLVPDYSSAFITAGRGTKGSASGEYISGNFYVTGGVTADESLGVIYMPNATSQTITIDESKMAAGYTARWVDPTNGASSGTTAGSTYTKTGANAAGGPDWLLVLEGAPTVTGAAAASFGFTGTAQGIPRTPGAAAASFGFTGSGLGTPRTSGQAVASFGFTGTAVGAPRTLGQAAATFGFTGTGVGVPRAVGTAVGSFGFTATAAGTPRTAGAAVAAFGFIATTQGVPRALGVAVGTYGFTATAQGVVGTPPVQGTATAAFGFTATASGVDRALGVAVATFGGTYTATGTRRPTGQATGTFGYTAAVIGLRRRPGSATGAFGFIAVVVVPSVADRDITATATLTRRQIRATVGDRPGATLTRRWTARLE